MKQRIITGLIAGSVFLLLLFLGGYWYTSMIFILAVLGFAEYLQMNKLKLARAASCISFAGVILMTFPYGELLQNQLKLLVWMAMFALFILTVISKNKLTLDHVAVYVLGIVYIGFGFHYMAETALLVDGRFWTLLVFVCIWATDSGAYFTGHAFGKRKLWPAISPNKTVEGALGGMILAVISAICFSLYAPELLTLGKAVILGVVIAIVGQMGDLIQSAYKRVRGIKDSGNILPGHGGILDRTDSWLIVFPLVHLLSLLPGT